MSRCKLETISFLRFFTFIFIFSDSFIDSRVAKSFSSILGVLYKERGIEVKWVDLFRVFGVLFKSIKDRRLAQRMTSCLKDQLDYKWNLQL